MGTQWAAQYLPDEGHLIPGLLFFHCFYSFPAVLLAVSICTSKKHAFPFILTFVTLTVVSVYYNHDYDLASDAQAAIGLIFIPIYTSFYGAVVFALGHAVQYLVGRGANDAMDADRRSDGTDSGK